MLERIVDVIQKSQPTKKLLVHKDAFGNVLTEVDQFIWCGCSDGVVRLFDSKVSSIYSKSLKLFLQTLKSKKELKVDNNSIVCMLKRTNQVWTGTDKGQIHIWNTTVRALFNLRDSSNSSQTLKPTKTLSGHTAAITSFTTVGPLEVWTCSFDQTLRSWNAQVGIRNKAC
jgi:hypothetical protein